MPRLTAPLALPDGAFAWLRAGGGLNGGAEHFGVSLALFRRRVNKTGVARRLAEGRVRARVARVRRRGVMGPITY
jgi:hypothetical protein